jgi:hypothetical protein
VDKEPVSIKAAEVLSLCAALRDGIAMLGLDGVQQLDLLRDLGVAEQAAASPVDEPGMDAAVRAIRYALMEVADGPIAAFMADAAARIIGDGYGKLFR